MVDLDAIQARAKEADELEQDDTIGVGLDYVSGVVCLDPQTALTLVAELRAARDADAPPPPGRNEVLLREAAGRLRLQLDAARQVIEACREVGHGPTALHWNPQCVQCQAIANYDKAMGGK